MKKITTLPLTDIKIFDYIKITQHVSFPILIILKAVILYVIYKLVVENTINVKSCTLYDYFIRYSFLYKLRFRFT